MSFEIYLVTNRRDNKMYVGRTRKGADKRWRGHVYHAVTDHRDTKLCRAIRRYGKNAFSLQVLTTAETEAKADCMERLWIAALGTYQPQLGYNSTFGGRGCYHTPESAAKISAAKMGHEVTAATRAKLSSAIEKKLPENEIVRLYKAGYTTWEIGKKFGTSHTSIQRRLRKHGIQLPRGAAARYRKERRCLNQQ